MYSRQLTEVYLEPNMDLFCEKSWWLLALRLVTKYAFGLSIHPKNDSKTSSLRERYWMYKIICDIKDPIFFRRLLFFFVEIFLDYLALFFLETRMFRCFLSSQRNNFLMCESYCETCRAFFYRMCSGWEKVSTLVSLNIKIQSW